MPQGVMVRYADDFVIGFERKADAREMLSAVRERLAAFGVSMHEDNTVDRVRSTSGSGSTKPRRAAA